MKGIALVVIAAALLSNIHQVAAQAGFEKLGIGVMVGGSKLTGDIHKTHAGLTGGAFLRYWPRQAFAFTATTTFGSTTSGLDAIHTDLLTGSLSINLFPLPESNIKPVMSFGITNYHYTASDNNGQLLIATAGDRARDWDFALQLGAGVEFQTSENWTLNTMVNLTLTRSDRLDAIVEGPNDHFLTAMIGVAHYLNLNQSGSHEYASGRKRLEAEEITSARTDERQSEQVNPQRAELFSEGIYFEAGTSRLLEDSQEHLDKIYRFLFLNEDEKLQLVTMNDAPNANPQLLLDRAQVVKTYLVNLGIKPSRILIQEE